MNLHTNPHRRGLWSCDGKKHTDHQLRESEAHYYPAGTSTMLSRWMASS